MLGRPWLAVASTRSLGRGGELPLPIPRQAAGLTLEFPEATRTVHTTEVACRTFNRKGHPINT